MSKMILITAMVACSAGAWADLEPGHVAGRLNEAQRNAARNASDAGELLVRGDVQGARDLK
jgi:hypothetical protein